MEIKKTLLYVFSSIVGLVVFFSCESKIFNEEDELIDYINNIENGYHKSKVVNGVVYDLLYKPTDLIVSHEFSFSNDRFFNVDSLRNKYKKFLYFNISMSKENKELLSVAPANKNDFGAMVNQLAFGMKNKVHLFNNKKDTIDMIDYVYPRLYGMTKSTSMMFVYPRNKDFLNQETLNITIEDIGLQTGEVRFEIDISKINNEPKLSFKN